MRHEFRLADIGEGLEEAEVVAWMVGVGDVVSRDQPLVEVMTDKSNAELPAPAAGTVVRLGAAVGDIVNVGELIAVIETEASVEDAGGPPADEQGHSAAPSEALPLSTPVGETVSLAPSSPITGSEADAVADQVSAARPKASPSTRRAAAERGIDLATVVGSGPGGRILLSDLDTTTSPDTSPSPDQSLPDQIVEIAAAEPDPHRASQPAAAPDASDESASPTASVQASPSAPAPAPAPPTAPTQPATGADTTPGVVPLRGVRRAVAQNMARSWFDIPHIHSFQQIDAEPLLAMRSRLRESDRSEYQSVTPLAFFVAAVARALLANPIANASIDMAAETISYHSHVNVGVAVAAPQGLVVPVVHHAETLSFPDLCVQLGGLVAAARAGTLPRESFRGGTVTITNFGSLGGEQATPLIRPPEAMILGFGSIAARPFVVDDEVVARKTINLVAGADHRLIDGDVATAVLGHIAEDLGDPLRLVL